MEKWKINAWWEKKSPEAIKEVEARYGKPIDEIIKEETQRQNQSILNEIPKQIKKEKKDIQSYNISLVSGLGWLTLMMGGMVAATTGWMYGDFPQHIDALRDPALVNALKNPNVINAMQAGGLASTFVGLLGACAGIGLGNGWKYEGECAREARANIRELKQLQKKLKKEVELANE